MRSHDPYLFRRAPRPHPLQGDYRTARQEREAWLYLSLIVATITALLLLGCVRQRPYPAAYHSRARYLRSSAIRAREAEAELHAAREAQRRVRSLHPATTY